MAHPQTNFSSNFQGVDPPLEGYWHDDPIPCGSGNVVTDIYPNPDGVPQVEKGMSAEPAFSILPVSKGGTGKTNEKAALNQLTSQMTHYDTQPDDETLLVQKFGTPTDGNGALYTRPYSYLWAYIKSKISSVLGLSENGYTGNAATATIATSATSAGKLTASKTIAISGGATGTATAFDGSANITIPVTKLGFGTNNAINSVPLGYSSLTGLRSGDQDKPYVQWKNIAGKAFTVGGLTYYGYVLNSNSSATLTYGVNSVTINNTTSNNWVVLVIDDSTYLGSASFNGYDRCSFTLDGRQTYRRSIANNYAIGSAYAVAVNVGFGSFENATASAVLLAVCASGSDNYSGNLSVASGYSSISSGNYSVASGSVSVAAGQYSVASGNSSLASGGVSVASGNNSVASGAYSVAAGQYSVAQHTGAHVAAYNGISGNDYQHVVGKWNAIENNRAFVIGWGTAENDRKNVMSVGTDGEIYFKESNTGLSTQLAGKLGTSGDGSNVTSTFSKATGDTSTMTSGGKLFAIFTAISSFFASLKALAFKDKAAYSDLSSGVQSSLDKADSALQSHQSVTDNNPTLAWGDTSKVGKVGSTDLRVTMPTNPASTKYLSFTNFDDFVPAIDEVVQYNINGAYTNGPSGADSSGYWGILQVFWRNESPYQLFFNSAKMWVRYTTTQTGDSWTNWNPWTLVNSDASNITSGTFDAARIPTSLPNVTAGAASAAASGSTLETAIEGKVPYIQGVYSESSATRYYKLASFATPGSNNRASLIIQGSCGRWQASGQYEYNLYIAIRDNVILHHTVIRGTYNTLVYFALYKETDNSYSLYAVVSANVYGCITASFIKSSDVSIEYTGTAVTPTGSLVGDSLGERGRLFVTSPYNGKGSTTTPVYVDPNGQVQPCDVLSGGTSNFNRTFTTTYTVGSTDQYITTLIKNDSTDLIADYVAWHNANYGKLSSPPMIIISVSARDTNVANAGLISLNMYRTGNGCDVFGEKYAYMGNQHGSQAYNTQYFTDQTFVSGAAYYLNIRNETPNTMWAAGTILDISIRIVAHAVSVT